MELIGRWSDSAVPVFCADLRQSFSLSDFIHRVACRRIQF
jgi:hypothetical protein